MRSSLPSPGPIDVGGAMLAVGGWAAPPPPPPPPPSSPPPQAAERSNIAAPNAASTGQRPAPIRVRVIHPPPLHPVVLRSPAVRSPSDPASMPGELAAPWP